MKTLLDSITDGLERLGISATITDANAYGCELALRGHPAALKRLGEAMQLEFGTVTDQVLDGEMLVIYREQGEATLRILERLGRIQ